MKNIGSIFFSIFFSFQINAQICTELLVDCKPELDAFIADNMDLFNCKQFNGTCNSATFSDDISREGFMSIGTVKSDAALTVKQGIITNKVKITNSIASFSQGDAVWGDFVFEDDYKLLTLEQVENFVNKNGHLPGVDSGEEIEEQGGFELAEITLAQQIKIEEGFLHLIDLNERLQKLELEKETLKFEKELLLLLIEMKIK